MTNVPSAPNFYLRNARSLSGTLILEMRSGWGRSSPRSRRESLMSWKDVEGVVHHQSLFYIPQIIRTGLTRYFGIETTWELVARKKHKTCSYSQYVLIIGKSPVTIQSLSLTGLRRYYATSRCRYQLMHPGSPTWLSEIETQSSPSSGARDTTFRLG